MQETHIFCNQRRTGIEFLKDVPWGTHICGFYQTKKDLLDILIPFFKTGLENNEYCIWVVSEPLSILEAKQALVDVVPNFYSNYDQQIEILSDSEWYLKYGDFNGSQVIAGWLYKIQYALAKDYEGIRVSGNTTWLKKRYWKAFMDYEALVQKEFGDLNIIALCTYKLDDCAFHEIVDVVNNHQFSFIKGSSDWQDTKGIAKYQQLIMIGKLAAGIAHEIRNPMTSIRGFLQLLQRKSEFEGYNEFFTLMLDELDRANGIISEYLSLSRNHDINLQKDNINNIISALIPLLQADAIEEDKRIDLDLGNIADLDINPTEIRQVILNLVRNGLESMEAGGIMNIRTYKQETGIVLEIRDSGNGIPDHIIKNLGTPFLTTKENGTGLGLSICLNILNRHNAKINVESSASGTSFVIQFPHGEQLQ